VTAVAGHVDGRRAIAERNVQSIVDAAVRLLGHSPDAGMGEVAAAAGVGRATLYRHFPNREDLVGAIRTRARAETRAALRGAHLDEDDPERALRRALRALLEIGDRYRVISTVPEARQRGRSVVAAPLLELVERAQADGAVDPALDARSVVALARGLLLAAFEEVTEGRLSLDAAADLAARTLLDGVRPRA
jgi:TetR/AcrR family transcriptional regulator, mexCD-oprJ operon repressor